MRPPPRPAPPSGTRGGRVLIILVAAITMLMVVGIVVGFVLVGSDSESNGLPAAETTVAWELDRSAAAG